jgi:predicted amidohydrolase
VKISAVQYPIEYGLSLPGLLAKVDRYIQQAQDEGGKLVVFPELFVLDLLPKGAVGATERAAVEKIVSRDGEAVLRHIREAAREKHLTILAGSVPRRTESGAVRNTAHLFFPDGTDFAQDKLFLTPWEKDYGWQAGDTLKVLDAPWGRTAILVCYDCQFALLSQQLAPYAPEVILVPSMTTEKGFHRVRWAAQSRAVEHHAYVVVTGTTETGPGKLAEKDYVGQAAFLTPQEESFPGLLREGELNGDQVVTEELDLAHLRQSRESSGLYSARHSLENGADRSIRVEECALRPGAGAPACSVVGPRKQAVE